MKNSSPSSIEWDYNMFYEYYRTNTPFSDRLNPAPIVSFVYESKRPKKDDAYGLEPFVRIHLVYADKSPVQNKTLFPNGLYTLVEENPGSKRYVFFVFPTIDATTKIPIANHFTFCFDKSDKKKSCHFHTTFYIYFPNGRWNDTSFKDFFPDKLTLPVSGIDVPIIRNAENIPYKEPILDLMRYPLKAKNSKSPPKQVAGFDGQYHAAPILCQEFAIKWISCAVNSMYAFAIKLENNTYQWSVCIARAGKGCAKYHTSYIFTTRSMSEAIFQQTLAPLIQIED